MSSLKLQPPEKRKLVEILSYYQKNSYLYPGTIQRHTGASLDESYIFLKELEKIGILEKAYEVICPNCNGTLDIYDSLNEIPDSIICNNCDHEFHPFNYALVIFKVINE